MEIYRSIADVPPARWDNAAGGDLGFDRPLLETCEQCADHRCVYFVHDPPGGSAVAATGLEFRDPASSNPLTDLMLGRLDARLPLLRRAFGRLLILRAPFAYGCGIASVGASDEGKRLHSFLAELERYADGEGLAIVALNVNSENGSPASIFEQRDYARTISRPIARAHVTWSNWDEYLQMAKQGSPSAESTIRHEVRRAEKLGLRVSTWDPETLSEDRLRQLYDGHHLRMNLTPLRIAPDFFTRSLRSMGERAIVLVARLGAEVIGSTFILTGNGRSVLPLVGIDPEKGRHAFCYFNLVFYVPMRLATTHGWSAITYGSGAYAAKIRRGCRAELSRVFWRPHGGMARRYCRVITRAHATVYGLKYRRELAAREFSLPSK